MLTQSSINLEDLIGHMVFGQGGQPGAGGGGQPQAADGLADPGAGLPEDGGGLP